MRSALLSGERAACAHLQRNAPKPLAQRARRSNDGARRRQGEPRLHPLPAAALTLRATQEHHQPQWRHDAGSIGYDRQRSARKPTRAPRATFRPVSGNCQRGQENASLMTQRSAMFWERACFAAPPIRLPSVAGESEHRRRKAPPLSVPAGRAARSRSGADRGRVSSAGCPTRVTSQRVFLGGHRKSDGGGG